MDGLHASQMIGGNASGARSASDFYPTPPEVTHALLNFLNLPAATVIWEPACGDGHMLNVMLERGYQAKGSDIRYGADFLTVPCEPCDWIITNPPFSLADKFIERCAEHGKPFAMLLKSQYWHAQKRLALFRDHPPTYICPLTWRPDFTFGRSGSSPLMDVMWCIWTKSETHYVPLERPRLNKE